MIKKQYNGWKVINRSNRMSCTVNIRPEAAVTYIKNIETKRKVGHGPLAVFETRDAARNFVTKNRLFPEWHKKYWRIVKCIFIKSHDNELWDVYRVYNGKIPKRTAFADSVTCLE